MVAVKAKAAPQKAKGKKRAKKDPSAPKRSLSAYMFFAKDKREDIISRSPALKSDISKVGKMIGEAWGKLAPNDRTPYEKKAQLDKGRYDREMAAWKKKA